LIQNYVIVEEFSIFFY